MDLLKEYDDSEDGEGDGTEVAEGMQSNQGEEQKGQMVSATPVSLINCAPDVDTYDLEIKNYKEKFKNIEKKIMFDDPTFLSVLNKPQQGPSINENYNFLKNASKNHYNGCIESTYVNKNMFDYQYNQFNLTGVTENPALKSCYKKNYQNYIVARSRDYELLNDGQPSYDQRCKKKRFKSERQDDDALERYKSPWEDKSSLYSKQGEKTEKGETLENDGVKADSQTNNEQTNNEKGGSKKAARKNAIMKLEACTLDEAIKKNVVNEKSTLYNDKVVSTLHIDEESNDYYHKSWFELPAEYKERDFMIEENFPPKKEIHTYKGHKMGVQKIRFFPKYGNYILSASLDHTLKLWGVYKSKSCVRTYKGHFKGVKDVLFDNDGANFLSCSYDNNVIYWDTEYGKIKGVYNQKKTPYCLCLNHDDPNTFLVGGANNKICHIDFRTGNIELEYNEHLQAINTITLCENNKKLISTSDDKKIFIWEYGLPVVVKYISDASMFSITAVSVHPSNNFFLCQSMNNVITVYESTGKFRLFSKKTFKGHHNIGYAINVSCSNDGKYVISGDSNGGLFIWNWKKMSNFKNMKAHQNVCIDCAWHPFKTSMLATASWDSTVKLWE
ncbi:pre-mRNA-processing factor 17, putative [Plasmodium vivax]|uniref:Pre-mRNA-processing factor 17 n=6 Tax=Plasmodium vivax TaxID=5855 RepID=A5K003_PLAVS|nr:pre-mRNA splicing factor PRP17, putative [Plasmodium vivax]KMZ78116.1 pre-mRNA splicing factor PRP17 [Plasmodium vivax India VII]KMZ84455.1 pre-mRNA splicing factor PRP17 [Plasmodium vivax Brazil I]KMZ90235.1 pre-mRNA splicing factor PRP17 [Plasmodium vivax Mauritania I]KMZ96945.1 pre-mRNA splicing factor PRP17 [Plasmodium vivax North Korean]EDL47564.1 pre-mRNA splicing factor PRP17, putative [Plasmodium vivax]|eukprot:XP_001617291.1 pre-mRNA splicing factor PRP17 [Plasmodium vivax Sal-1]